MRAPERQGQRRTRVPVKTKRSMMKREESASPPGEAEGRYKGVRQRKWGRWVSEIRLPNSRERIWLGSYDSPKKAARAFDAAAVFLRGRHAARLNFPEAPPPRIPSSARPLTHQQIQAAAASHAYSSLPPPTPPLSFSSPPASVMADSVDIDAKEYWSFVESLQNFCGDFEIPTDDLAFDFFATAPEAEDESGSIDLGSESFLWSF